MKILRIRGENLASLAGSFEIDLEDGPLGRAGLFAITGPTGAGKTTILDAVCLALYNKVPRTASETNRSKAPAGGDSELSLDDPRHVLRRGAGTGYAEVEFRAVDGETYTARWSVHRSRKRATGKLQGQKLSLADATGQGIGGATNTSVLTAIAERTGLTFSQFRRAILLAQGDFAAFLKAGAEERANLLEAMTGTELYGRVSMLAHERRKSWEAEIDSAQQRLAIATPMDAEARAAVDAALVAAKEAEEATTKQHKAIDATRAWYRQLDERERTLALARQRRDEAQAAADAAAARRANYKAATRAWPLRASVRDVQAMDATARDLEHKATMAVAAVDAARAHMDSAAAARTDAERARARASASYVACLAADIERTRVAAAAVEAWLNEHSGIEPFAARGRLAELEDRVAQAAVVAARIAETETALSTLRGRIDKGGELVPTMLGEAREAEAEAEAAATAEQQALAALAAHDKDGAEARHRALSRRRELVVRVRGLDREVDQVEATRKRASHDVTEAEATRAEHAAALDTAIPALAAAAAKLSEAKRSLDKLQRALSAEQWRSQLEPDTECPVCGSTEHPWARDEAVRDLHNDHKARVEELDAAHQAAQQRKAQHESNIAAADKTIAAARNTADAARQQLAALANERDELVRSDPSIASGSVSEVEAALAAEQTVVDDLLAQINAAGEAARGASQRARDAAAQAATLRKKANEAEARLAKLRAEAEVAEAKHASDGDLLAQHHAAVTASLKGAGITVSGEHASGMGDGVQELRRRVDTWMSKRDQRAALADELRALESKHVAAEAVLPQDRAAVVGDLEPLVAPASVDETAATTRVAARLAEARTAATNAAKTWEEAQTASAAAETARAVAATARDSHGEALAAKRAALSHDLEAAGLTIEDVTPWLAKEDQWREREAAALDEIDNALVSANAIVKDQQTELDKYRATAPEQSRQEADAAAEAIEARLRSQREAVAEIAAQIIADDDKRKAATHGAQQLEQLRTRARPWLQIADLIGHNKGKTFKSYAQAVTLDILLHGANRHLRELNPRYELRASNLTELEVEVIDHDLADERRSVHHLSGGETFLTSLALALSLSSLAAGKTKLGSLFIDEGLGTLDIDTLDVALGILENLHDTGRQVGLISHVQGLAERVAARISVVPLGGGKSAIEIEGA